MNRHASAPFWWLSFLPALAYWWLEANAPLWVALAGGVGLAVLEITLEKVFSGKVHTLSKLNAGVLVMMAGLALLAREGVWFRLQPTITGLVCGGWLAWMLLRRKSLLEGAMADMGRPWPFPRAWLVAFERDACLFILGYALFMAWWAIKGSTGQWLFWKTGGQYLCFALFLAMEFLNLRRRVRQHNARRGR